MNKHISQPSQFAIAVPGIGREIQSLDEILKLCQSAVNLPEDQPGEEKEFLGVFLNCCY